MRPLDRRTLLLTGGALVVGAGAAEGGNALVTSAPVRRPPAPGEELMTEHGVLKRILLSYRAIVDRIDAGQRPPRGAVLDAAQIVSDYIEDFHEGLEEAYVFPRLLRADKQTALVRTLLVQHDRGRHLTAAILRTGNSDPRLLRTYLDRFVRMYEPHEAREDTVVFPTLRAITPQRTLDELAARFADEENAQFGDAALKTMLHRVGGVEEQLGIADLQNFTPPEM